MRGIEGLDDQSPQLDQIEAVLRRVGLFQPFPRAPLRMVVTDSEELASRAIDRSVETLSARSRKSDVVVLARLHHATSFSATRRDALAVVHQRSDEVPVVAVRCDLVLEVESVVTNDDPVSERSPTTDVSDGDVLVVVQRLREPERFLLE